MTTYIEDTIWRILQSLQWIMANDNKNDSLSIRNTNLELCHSMKL